VTATINGHRPDITDSDGVRMRVRTPETGPETAPEPVGRDKPAYTRVIPEIPTADQVLDKAKSAVSLHVTEAGYAWRDGWLLNETKPTLAGVAKQTFPAKAEAATKGAWLAMSAAGAFRTAGFTFAYLLEAALCTRMRAGVALILFVLTVAAVVVAHLLI
jgi:hypothetical protein